MKNEVGDCPDHFEKDCGECVKAAYVVLSDVLPGIELHHLTSDYISWLLTQDWLDKKTKQDLFNIIKHKDKRKKE
tara:strand:+ start:3619 stop:3843 length:225 start_codon:yes stop_codon:yes gene_type:complete